MDLYIDKRGQTPNIHQFSHVVHTFRDFISVTNTSDKLNLVSINYDIEPKANGMDFLWYLADNNIEVPFINIHSVSNEQRRQLRFAAKRYLPNSELTFVKHI